MEYYSAIKKCIPVSSNEVDEPRAYDTEWSKSEREREILYSNACLWNLESDTDEPFWRAAMETQT